MDLRAAYARAEADLARAERQLDSLTRRIDQLRLEKRGLELAMARHGEPAITSAPGTPAEANGVAMSRTDAILKVMEDRGSDAPLSPGAVVELLRQLGRNDDTPHSVSAALSYLHRQGKVHSQGRGRWVLAARPLRPLVAVRAPSEPPEPDDDEPVPDDEPEWEDFIQDDQDVG